MNILDISIPQIVMKLKHLIYKHVCCIYAMKADGVGYKAYINMPQYMTENNFNKLSITIKNATKNVAATYLRKEVMLLMCQCLSVEHDK